MKRLRLAAILAALLLAPPASALLIRPDRDDAEYLELATRYTSSVPLNAPDGEGVLIAPRWVLTAAHRARALQAMKAPPRLDIGGRSREIQGFFLHPGWKPGGDSDVALVLLREAVRNVEPTPPYRGSDEAGKSVVIVGHGDTGKIGETALPGQRRDSKKRAAINTVDRVNPRALGLRIKPLDDASDLQGAATPGDSGGPAFIETPQGLFVAGIGYALENDWQLYARVSAYAPWIDSTMLEVARKEADALLGDTGR